MEYTGVETGAPTEIPLKPGRPAETRKPITTQNAMNELMAKIDALLMHQGIDPEEIERESNATD